MIRIFGLVAVFLFPGTLGALEISMPAGSFLTVDKVTEQGSYDVPTGRFADGHLPSLPMTGYVSRQIWQLDGQRIATEQLIEPLRRQALAAGFDVLLDCDASSCGGFDFRFATEVLPAPEMFVDLIDYRFFSARRDTEAGKEALSVLVSRTDRAGLIQLIAVQPGAESLALSLAKDTAAPTLPPASVANPAIPGDVAKALDVGGHAILHDLAFETGSAVLEDRDFASLNALAAYLADHPNLRIALVGHTDNVGALENNIALSEKRATAVRDHLVTNHGVALSQLEAQGVGYLAPVASNLTDAGRTANRRVEAVVLGN
ncbi:OmpA family protein [Cognatishimia sp. SS12]|uniref:OmpA family protein n=1 Tax=Cognatishimia sp. SS12 TaxID=2979465 RepID=UPI00233003C3|nr:OmpA family protein [Cognatishimia sp. SS12]MDC0737599.1 OmpA family protein [Cognatishimia sp. SS12]